MRRGNRSRRRSWSVRYRPAFTIIEIVVVILIIGILTTLLIPAVQRAREASRRVQCANNLHQLGIALQAYNSAVGVFPAANNGLVYSIHAMLLPYMDQVPLYNAVNFQVDARRPALENHTVHRVQIASFLCPSDSGPPNHYGWTSYAGNFGFWPPRNGFNGAFAPEKPVWGSTAAPPGHFSGRDFPDGMSSTAAMAECLLGPPRAYIKDARRSAFMLPGPFSDPDDLDLFASECHDLDVARGDIGFNPRGMLWLAGESGHTLYDHVLAINDHSCIISGRPAPTAFAASSLHPGGANILFVDAHVKFIKQIINLYVWRSLGTRAGGEVVSEDSY